MPIGPHARTFSVAGEIERGTKMPPSHIHTTAMFLAWRDSSGKIHYQPWSALPTAGVPVDPASGEGMNLLGWSTVDG